MSHLLIQADARRVPLADESVHAVITSPPYWGLRDYGTATWAGGDPDCDHKREVKPSTERVKAAGYSDAFRNGSGRSNHAEEPTYPDLCGKCGARRIDAQIGLEPTPEAYVASMVAVFREAWRVLRDDGTCWVNLGDSYAAGKPKSINSNGWDDLGWMNTQSRNAKEIGLKPKDLVGIPWRVAFALQADGWFLRSDIIWAKPNPMPESVTDRPTKSHEYLFLLTKQERYYFDQEAVREPHKEMRSFLGKEAKTIYRGAISGGADNRYAPGPCGYGQPEAGRNIRSVWSIPTESYAGAHFATFPRKLVEPCIKAGTSERGACPTCGAPWERAVESETNGGWTAQYQKQNGELNIFAGGSSAPTSRGKRCSGADNPAKKTMLGWRPTCSCHGHFETIEPDPTDTYARPTRVYIPDGPQPKPVPCVVLDPFAGSGTTLVVAEALGRVRIGCDLSADYLAQAKRRIERPHQPLTKQREQTMPLFAHMEDA